MCFVEDPKQCTMPSLAQVKRCVVARGLAAFLRRQLCLDPGVSLLSRIAQSSEPVTTNYGHVAPLVQEILTIRSNPRRRRT